MRRGVNIRAAALLVSLTAVVAIATALTVVVFYDSCEANAGPAPRGKTALAAPRLRRAIAWLVRSDKRKISRRRAARLARLFAKYGRLWNIDPWLAAVVSFRESGFRDKPRRVKVWRCRKISGVAGGEVCVNKWPGDRGLLQVVPKYAQDSFTACRELVTGDPWNLYDTETSICVGVHLMSRRRASIAERIQKRRSFMARGSRHRWLRRYAPCGSRQIRFCRNGYSRLCKKFWWIASWNWGSHRVFCGGRWQYDFPGYPIRVLKRYRRIVAKFRTKGRLGSKK